MHFDQIDIDAVKGRIVAEPAGIIRSAGLVIFASNLSVTALPLQIGMAFWQDCSPNDSYQLYNHRFSK